MDLVWLSSVHACFLNSITNLFAMSVSFQRPHVQKSHNREVYDLGWHNHPVQLHTEITDHNMQRWIGTSDLNLYSLSHSAIMLGNSDSINHKSSTINQDTGLINIFLICIQLFCWFLWLSVQNNHTRSVNKVRRLPAYRTTWQHCRLTLHVKGR